MRNLQSGHSTFKAVAGMLIFCMAAGCAGTGEQREAGSSPAPRAPRYDDAFLDLNLATASRDVRTIQLYLGADERNLPVLPLPSGEQLTLEFDLMGEDPRPLSVYFYHADRSWRRDLSPAEYLSAFHRDDLLDYTRSNTMDRRYVHYTYAFPNDDIRFEISGNYVLRVTEMGLEDDVLFERAFFVSEQVAPAEMGAENLLYGGPFPVTLPIVRFTPPAAIQGNVFDYDVCFVRNGRLERSRCTDQPVLAAQPALQFDLQPEEGFRPEAADYFLDLSNLRVGPRIEATDLAGSPYRVTLQPDYAAFPGDGLSPLLNGQPVVSGAVRDLTEADVAGEYVDVLFSYVPPEEQPLEGELIVTGSFNNWQYDPANRLSWVPEVKRYEGYVTLKQGQYEYRYFSPDRRLRRLQLSAAPRMENLYNAFVYYTDIHLHTDRLLTVSGMVTR